ncbi:hypothetical protein ACH5RR_023631 [Cinchona calisaya]|uniref:Uncharacterized protein n=1 Tax=Cinchona calisaya TaxID=153742 RepID=A0ABD2ZCQ3_9GENT
MASVTPGFAKGIPRFTALPDKEKFKMVNQEGFSKSRVKKIEDRLNKLKIDIPEKKINHFIYTCLGGETITNFGIIDLIHMDRMIDQNIEKAKQRLFLLKKDMLQPPAINIPFAKKP